MASVRFSDDEWQRIWALLEEHSGIYARQEAATRRFVEAVLWMARAGSPWRLLPGELGPWNSVYKRFARRLDRTGQEKGVWQMLMERLAADGDLEWLMLDSPIARSSAAIHRRSGRRQQTPAGYVLTPALPEQKNEGEQCLGRSRGGFFTKLHGLADSLGNPLRFALTAGQAGDAPQAIALLATARGHGRGRARRSRPRCRPRIATPSSSGSSPKGPNR